jgi:hypothetical protein
MPTTYECEIGHIFIFPAKIVGPVGLQSDTVEVHVCPFCHSLKLKEHVEPEESITSVKRVDLADVDELLKKGYVVRELYAKSATLVLKEVKP